MGQHSGLTDLGDEKPIDAANFKERSISGFVPNPPVGESNRGGGWSNEKG